VATPGSSPTARHVGHDHPWFDAADRRSYEQVERAFTELTKTVDPDDPWSHPRARELDDVSVSAWYG
jgi:monoamine oxidase